jgi:hypothetical protein
MQVPTSPKIALLSTHPNHFIQRLRINIIRVVILQQLFLVAVLRGVEDSTLVCDRVDHIVIPGSLIMVTINVPPPYLQVAHA